MDLITTGAALVVGKKLLGKTMDLVSEDIAKIYAAGRDKIIYVAVRKIKNVDDGLHTNLRVTRDVFLNGSFTDEAICAEYFGGILSSSRSQDGKDDSGIYYVDLIKSLSATQLLAHYMIYRSLNKLLLETSEKRDLNVGDQNDLKKMTIYFSSIEFGKFLKSDSRVVTDLFAIYHKGLLSSFRAEGRKLEDGKMVPYLEVVPSSLGVQLYAIANNEFEYWREYPIKDLGEFKDIQNPKFFAFSIDILLEKARLKDN